MSDLLRNNKSISVKIWHGQNAHGVGYYSWKRGVPQQWICCVFEFPSPKLRCNNVVRVSDFIQFQMEDQMISGFRSVFGCLCNVSFCFSLNKKLYCLSPPKWLQAKKMFGVTLGYHKWSFRCPVSNKSLVSNKHPSEIGILRPVTNPLSINIKVPVLYMPFAKSRLNQTS